MIRFYKTIAKIVRTLKSYLTGAVLKIRYFSYNVIALCYSGKEKAKRGVKWYGIESTLSEGEINSMLDSGISADEIMKNHCTLICLDAATSSQSDFVEALESWKKKKNRYFVKREQGN